MEGRYCNKSVTLVEILILLSLVSSIYSRALGSHRNAWRPGHKKHRYMTETPFHWDSSLKKREHFHQSTTDGGSSWRGNDFVDECCPSVTEIYQPLGGVSKDGRILELYRDQNLTQSFYQTSCAEGVKGRPCQYVDEHRYRSYCVQQYSYTYALVRELYSIGPSRLDYIRIRSGCSCEIQLKNPRYELYRSERRKRLEDML